MGRRFMTAFFTCYSPDRSANYLAGNVVVVKETSDTEANGVAFADYAGHPAYALNSQLITLPVRRGNKHFDTNFTSGWRASST